MGNRAVITTPEDYLNKDTGLGVYLHWNGGRDSVVPLLRYCKMRGFRCPESSQYGWARFAQVAANFLGMEGLSIGIGRVSELDCDNYDNGVYLIRDWEIVGREFVCHPEQNTYDELEFLLSLDENQPESQKLGRELIEFLYRYDLTVWDLDGWSITHPPKEDPIPERTFGHDGEAELLDHGRRESLCRILSVDGTSILFDDNGTQCVAKDRTYLPRQHMEVAVSDSSGSVKVLIPKK